MPSKLKQQLEVMKIGEKNRNERIYPPPLFIDHICRIPIPHPLPEEEFQKRLQKIADEMKDYTKKEVFIIDSLANMMPNGRR